MTDRIIFHLARYFPPRTMLASDMAHPETLYGQIRNGRKTSEWRDCSGSQYWLDRLLSHWKGNLREIVSLKPIDCTTDLKVHKAWFVQAYPKENMPRLEANILALFYHPASMQLEIRFKVTSEVTTKGIKCFWR